MAEGQNLGPDFEVRKLPFHHKQRLGFLLNVNDAWMDVMGSIESTKKAGEMRFSDQHIKDVKSAARDLGVTGAEVLIDEWGTMGQQRPTVQNLLDLCLRVECITAASYISHEIMGGEEIRPDSADDETRELNFDHFDELIEVEVDLENSDFISGPFQPKNTLGVHELPYSYIKRLSNDFAEEIGVGGFATVYLGTTSRSENKVAIKRLNRGVELAERAKMEELMNFEIDLLPRLKHPNIIELLGYSNDSPENLCLLYRHMPNGTLAQKLAVEAKSEALPAGKRVDIAYGTSRGLLHLHTQNKVLVHRDIKSSNILLDTDLTPKIADFGLLRYGVSGHGDTVTHTISVRGTPAYMPPEAKNGEISSLWDVWSFGVVILELITGLPARRRNSPDLVTFAQKQARDPDFHPRNIFDKLADWNEEIGVELYKISTKCLEEETVRRADSEAVVKLLEAIQNAQG